MKQKTQQNFAIVMAIVLATALIITATCTDGFMHWNNYCLFGHDYGEDGKCVRCSKDKPIEELDKATNNVVIQNVMAQGMQLNAAPAPLADNPDAYTLTAAITPESADDKRVEWTINWNNSQSVWATGKTVTEYVTVTPTSENALTATVACVKDFGEQVIVTVKSLDNAEASAACTVDYVQRITGFTFNMPDVSSTTMSFTYDIVYSNYTIASEVSFDVSDKLTVADTFCDIIDDYLAEFDYSVLFAAPKLSKTDKTLVLSADTDTMISSLPNANYFNDFTKFNGLIGAFIYYDKEEAQVCSVTDGDIIYAFRQAIASNARCSFDVTYFAKYDGKIYSQGTQTINLTIDGQALHVPVDSVKLSQGTIVF